jgi:hypothetical protein
MKIDTLDIIIITLSIICIIIIIQIFRYYKLKKHFTCNCCKKKSKGLSISDTNYTVNELIEVILNDDKNINDKNKNINDKNINDKNINDNKITNVENRTDISYTIYNKQENKKKDHDNDSLEEISLL